MRYEVIDWNCGVAFSSNSLTQAQSMCDDLNADGGAFDVWDAQASVFAKASGQ